MLRENKNQAHIIDTNEDDENNGSINQKNLTINASLLENDVESIKINRSSLLAINFPLLEHSSSDSISNIELDFIAFKQSDIESRKLLKDLILKILEIENTKPKKNQILEDIKKLIVDLELEKIDLQKKLEESISFCNIMLRIVTKTKSEINSNNINMQKISKEYEEKIKTCQKIENEIKNEKDKSKLVNLYCHSLHPLKSELFNLVDIYKHKQDFFISRKKNQERYEKKIIKKQTAIKFIEKTLNECDGFLVACKNGMLMHRDDEEKLQKLFDQLLIKNIEIHFTNLFDQKANKIYLIFYLSKDILEKQRKFYSLIEKKITFGVAIFDKKIITLLIKTIP